ncbi:MAG TPA: nuclear transport factor 2 family protein [Candidatus Eisenbacteria bacterium]|nr:nuclear transport factor 2 family protein [Candidatus Eisenbacteria bacterium]
MPSKEELEVVAAAERRAAALAGRDADTLRALLHPAFRWTTFKGEVLSREQYVAGNVAGDLVWCRQRLDDVDVTVVGTTAVLTAVVTDVVRRAGSERTFRLRLTQTWVRGADGWQCLAGHAGPELPSS